MPQVRAKTIKPLQENMGRKFHGPGLRNGFLDVIPTVQVTKEKKHKLDYIKRLCKEHYQQSERQPMKLEKMCKYLNKINIQKNVPDKEIISGTDKELLQLNTNKEKKNLIKKWARKIKQAFLQRQYTSGQ